jgi:hypothetical protein
MDSKATSGDASAVDTRGVAALNDAEFALKGLFALLRSEPLAITCIGC